MIDTVAVADFIGGPASGTRRIAHALAAEWAAAPARIAAANATAASMRVDLGWLAR